MQRWILVMGVVVVFLPLMVLADTGDLFPKAGTQAPPAVPSAPDSAAQPAPSIVQPEAAPLVPPATQPAPATSKIVKPAATQTAKATATPPATQPTTQPAKPLPPILSVLEITKTIPPGDIPPLIPNKQGLGRGWTDAQKAAVNTAGAKFEGRDVILTLAYNSGGQVAQVNGQPVLGFSSFIKLPTLPVYVTVQCPQGPNTRAQLLTLNWGDVLRVTGKVKHCGLERGGNGWELILDNVTDVTVVSKAKPVVAGH